MDIGFGHGGITLESRFADLDQPVLLTGIQALLRLLLEQRRLDMAAGLKTATGEFILVFDADFLPAPDFLRKTIDYFTDPAVGMVQTPWAHLNRGDSWLTHLQADNAGRPLRHGLFGAGARTSAGDQTEEKDDHDGRTDGHDGPRLGRARLARR